MLAITHDEAVKLHMGRFEQMRIDSTVILNEYCKAYQSGTYRMRKGDINRAKKYIKDIKFCLTSVSNVLKEFEKIV